MFARAAVRARMQHQKRQFELICPDQFFRECANGDGVKSRIRRGEINEVVGVPED